MTAFELAYCCAEPFLPPLYGMVRRHLRAIAAAHPGAPDILDVGGRRSHYTIGVPGRVTISELPRESDVQTQLNLGLTPAMAGATQARRSNVRAVVFDDMTRSALPAAAFDCVVAVEVLEHVEEDAAFVREVRRVLRPGGVFLMTTPNGDSEPVPYNADHKRHYTRAALSALLAGAFDDVRVHYAVVGGAFRRAGLRSWSPRHPARTLASMAGNVINTAQSSLDGVRERALGTRHLVATARRSR